MTRSRRVKLNGLRASLNARTTRQVIPWAVAVQITSPLRSSISAANIRADSHGWWFSVRWNADCEHKNSYSRESSDFGWGERDVALKLEEDESAIAESFRKKRGFLPP